MSNNDNNSIISQYNSARPWAVYYKQQKNNLEEINTGLLKHLENLDKENVFIIFYYIKLYYINRLDESKRSINRT
jgi:hypothetical protein